MTNQNTEQNRELNRLFNALMQVPHRNYDLLVPEFRGLIESFPMFGSRAAAWTALNSNIRDQVDCAIIALLQSDPTYLEYREAGQALLLGNSFYKTEPYPVPGLPPFRIFRIAEWIHRSDRKIPRRMRDIMNHYLTTIQADPAWFESIAIRNRKELKDAMHTYNVFATELGAVVKYGATPPEDSRLGAIRTIANTEDIMEQARLIMENKIPYQIAQSLFVEKITSPVMIALIDVMTPTEALNARQWVQESGLLNVPEVRDVYQKKVADATASVATIMHRKSAQGTDEGVQQAVNQAAEKAAAKGKRIKGVTDVWLDVSVSMDSVIAETPQFASRLYPLADDVQLIAHNDSAWAIRVRDTGNPFKDVTEALKGLKTDGMTGFACALNLSVRSGRLPERIVALTDGGENSGSLANALQRYEDQTGIHPQVIMLHFSGDPDRLTPTLKAKGFEVNKFEFKEGEYYVLDQVVAFLQGEAPKSMVEKIMEIELPRIVR